VTNRKGKIVGFVNRNTVSVIDTSTNTVTSTVPVGLSPQYIVIG